MLRFTDAEIQAKAEEMGLVKAGEPIPKASMQSRVKAALMADRASVVKPADVPVAQSILVQPGAGVEIDGRPFPWIVQADAIEVTLAPDGSGLVRLTIPTQSVQITKPEGE